MVTKGLLAYASLQGPHHDLGHNICYLMSVSSTRILVLMFGKLKQLRDMTFVFPIWDRPYTCMHALRKQNVSID